MMYKTFSFWSDLESAAPDGRSSRGQSEEETRGHGVVGWGLFRGMECWPRRLDGEDLGKQKNAIGTGTGGDIESSPVLRSIRMRCHFFRAFLNVAANLVGEALGKSRSVNSTSCSSQRDIGSPRLALSPAVTTWSFLHPIPLSRCPSPRGTVFRPRTGPTEMHGINGIRGTAIVGEHSVPRGRASCFCPHGSSSPRQCSRSASSARGTAAYVARP